MTGVLVATMMQATSYAQSNNEKQWFTSEEISPNFDLNNATIDELEAFLKLRITLESDITRKLKAEDIWSKDIDKGLVSKPKDCGKEPNIFLMGQRKEYKDCLIIAIKQEDKRIDELVALLPDVENTTSSDTIQVTPFTITTSDSTSTESEATDVTLDLTNNDLKNTDVEQVTKLVEGKLEESEPAVKIEKVVKQWTKKDGEAMPF